tara:strand:+ start:65 stop:454 length:390 start_codon:yes stop_codon:yes gene_type:complete
MNYGYQKKTLLPFDKVDHLIREALSKVGFGIISEIDIQKTFKEKLDIDYNRYIVLGACNPMMANKALTIEPEVGMLMPCNIIFWENKNNSVTISGIDAEKQLGNTNNDELIKIGRDVNALLKQAIDSIN